MVKTGGKKLRLRTEEAKKLLRRITTFLANASEGIDRRLSQRGLRGRYRKLRAVNAVAVSALESLDLVKILRRSLRETVLVTNADAGIIHLTEGEGEHPTMVCQQGLPDKVVEEMREPMAEGDVPKSVRSERGTLAMADPRRRDYPEAEMWAKYGYRSFLRAPIFCGESVLGAITVLQTKDNAFSKLDADILNSIATVLGPPIEKARRYEEMGNALLSIRRMSRVAWDRGPSENLDEVLERFARKACEATLALSSMVTVVDGKGRVAHRATFGHTKRGLSAAPRMDALSVRALKRRECVVLSQPAEVRESLGEDLLEAGYASAVCVPLLVGDSPLGALWLSYEMPRKFASWEIEQLERLADRVAGAIEASRLESAARQRAELYRAMDERCERMRSSTELKDLMQCLADSARALVRGRMAVARFSSGDISAEAVSACPGSGTERKEVSAGRKASSTVIVRALFESREAAEHRGLYERGEDIALPREGLRKEGLVAVPLLNEENEPAGLLAVREKLDDGDFTEEDAELLRALSERATASIGNVVRYECARRLLEEYRSLLDGVAVAIVTVNKEQVVTTVNKKFEELTGFSRQEVEGKMTLGDFLPEVEREGESGFWEGRAGSAVSPGSRESLLRTNVGQERRVNVSVRATEDGGSIALYLTEQREDRPPEPDHVTGTAPPALDAVVPTVLRRLQEWVVASTADLDALLKREWPHDASQKLEALSVKIQECRRTLEALKMRAKPPPVAQKPVDINELITNLVEEKEAERRGENLGVVLRLDADLSAVPADEEQLRWALGELIEYCRRTKGDAGSVATVRIETERRERAARITVGDARRGAPSEKLEGLFELPEARGETVGETNLSLFACRAIMERHGWQISAEYDPEKGAAFVIEFPLPEDTPPRAEATPAKPIAEYPPEERPLGEAMRKILIVDDEDVVIDFLDYYLRSQGHRVETSRSGRDGQRRLKEGEYGLVFWDLSMPDVAGQELFRWLEENKPGMTARIIFVTAGMTSAETLSFLREPRKKWLEKPFDLTELRTLVAEVLGEVRE